MKIEDNKVVEVSYELTVGEQVVDRATKEKPLDYIHGSHMLIPKFETEIEGKEPGDSFEFILTPNEAYGDRDPKKVFDIPKESFAMNGEIMTELLQVGRIVPMLNKANQVVQGTVMEVKENDVTMDFNHPMAGKTLHFKGEVLSVRSATEKELTEGLHGEFLPQEDCCCGHHHGGGCCGGHGHHHEEGHECCGGHGHHHEDGHECCGGHGHHHEDGHECCGGHGHHHEDGHECCCGGHHEE